ncbi:MULTISPECIES: hypothetical protein [unclassified Devosia]|uniref:hypothetical protein n=1 Tax=unclassified Devosia TaxID=196773 RepID=UPI0015F7BE0E|nr:MULTISPECIES: hypothetical protein [unclassified Devosia]MBJ6988363.1 hypothetical protein [Devosia sp. MC521]MBK1795940.1 hypothetical protein [Devosia sp. WQ 349K1]QMW63024.1 hypothetical protein H4N61_01265 [Devosia sp. MC521]
MQPQQNDRDEYVTIFANSAADAMAQYWARGMDRQGYLIAGRIGPHEIRSSDGCEVFSTQGLVAATFSRRVAS